jgi:WS/DGAT/MGAT family acyltransferase
MDKPLQRIDHIMWDSDAPNSIATIAGVMTFKKPLHKERMLEIVKSRLLRFERFQKTIIIKDGSPMWHLDENFQLQNHIHHIALPGKGDYKELQQFVSDMISQPLNYNKPLWDIHLIDNYQGGSALLWRVHHAIGDGLALVKVIFSLTGITAKDSLAVFGEEGEAKKAKVKDNIEYIVDLGVSIYEDAKQLLSNPHILTDTLQHNWTLLKEAGELLKGKTVNKLYKGDSGTVKKASWTEPLPLAAFKRLGKHYDAKINDVMLTVVAGAIRKHLQRHKQSVAESVKIVMPVNMRRTTEIKSLHNEFSFITVDLPVHISSFEKRLAYIKERTAAFKPSANSLLMTELIHIVADYTPLNAKQKLLGFLGRSVAGIVTNVPGPQHSIYLAGGKVEDLMFWVPHTVPLGIGISLMSYNGKVYMGIVTDEILLQDPDMITGAFASELARAEKAIK